MKLGDVGNILCVKIIKWGLFHCFRMQCSEVFCLYLQFIINVKETECHA